MPIKKINIKGNVAKIVLVSYLVLSILYIAGDVFQNTKTYIYNVGVQNGQNMTVNSLIKQSLDTSCTSFKVFNEQTAVELINVKCLQQAAPQAPVQGEAPAQEDAE